MRRALKTLENPREWSKELGRAHRKVGGVVADKARAEANRGDPRLSVPHNRMLEHFASKIVGKGTVSGARVGLRGVKPEAVGAFWGAKGRSGWYLDQSIESRRIDGSGRVQVDYRLANDPSRGGRPQFGRWVGNSWDAGRLDQGPYAINPAVAKNQALIEATYKEVTDDLLARAFPDHKFAGGLRRG